MATSNQTFNIIFGIFFYIVVVLFVVFLVCPLNRKRNLNKQQTFPIPDEIVDIGRSHFAASKVLICGLAKNVSKNIGTIKKNVERIVSFFEGSHHKILIVENNSTDTSRQDLLNIKPFFEDNASSQDEKFIVLCPGTEEDGKCNFDVKSVCNSDNRIIKMVVLRNVYMKYIKQNFKDDEFDYCVMIDFDLDFDFCSESFLSCGYYFSSFPNSVSAIGGNGLSPLYSCLYYDMYSLSRKDTFFAYMNGFYKTKHPSGCIEGDLFKVESCFGGMVVYKYSSIYGKRYFFEKDIFSTTSGALCEHKSLNMNICGGGVFIHPRLVYYVK